MSNYFSTNLKYLRMQKGLSQNRLAELVKTNQPNINRWEDGSVSPGIDKVDEIAKYFNIPVSKLLSVDLRFENNNFKPEDAITMPTDTKRFKAGDIITMQELIDYANELQDKLDKIKESL